MSIEQLQASQLSKFAKKMVPAALATTLVVSKDYTALQADVSKHSTIKYCDKKMNHAISAYKLAHSTAKRNTLDK